MSVAASIDVEILPWQGHRDIRLPAGVWSGRAVLAGDVTGGTSQISLTLANGQVRTDTRLWSLEQLSIFTNSDAAASMRFTVGGFAEFRGLELVRRWTIDLPIATGQTAAMLGRDLAMLPIYLGHQFNIGSAGTLDILGQNVNGVTNEVSALGYFWEAHARTKDGGLMRPGAGAFRS